MVDVSKETDFLEAEVNYNNSIIEWCVTVHNSKMRQFSWVQERLWKIRNNNRTQYRLACDRLGVDEI